MVRIFAGSVKEVGSMLGLGAGGELGLCKPSWRLGLGRQKGVVRSL